MAKRTSLSQMSELQQDESQVPQTEEMLSLITQTIRRHAHRQVSRATAKLLYEAIIEFMFLNTQQKGYFRLPSGWGSFYLKVLGEGAKARRLPTGTMVERKPKPIVRYAQGSIVRQLLNTQTAGEYRRAKPRRSAIEAALSDPALNETAGPSV